MKFSQFSLAIFAVLAIGVSGCSKSKDQTITEVVYSEQKAQKLIDEGKPLEAATEYTNIAELLFTPEGIQHADSLLDRALMLDASNPKANFLSAFVKIVLVTKHLEHRMAPLREIGGTLNDIPAQIYYEHSKLRKAVRGFQSQSAYSQFVKQSSDSVSQFKNYLDLQEHLKTVVLPVLEQGTAKLEKVLASGAKFDVRVDNGAWGANEYSNHDYSHSTYCYQNGGHWRCNYYVYSYYLEKPVAAQRLTADSNDLRVILGGLRAMTDSVRLSLAYSFEGLDRVIKEVVRVQKNRERFAKKFSHLRAIDRNISTRQLVEILRSEPKFLSLTDETQLSKIPYNSERIMREILDLGAMERELCGSETRRMTHLVASVCFTGNAVALATRNLEMLAGPSRVRIGYDEIGEPVEILMDVTALFRDPSRDLKSLLPNKFNRKGHAISYPDPTMGGLFPDGDLIERLKVIDAPGVSHID